MFDVNADDGSVRKRPYESPIPGKGDEGPKAMPKARLDSQPMVMLHHQLLDHYGREIDKQANNRAKMGVEEDFYDNEQWDPDDAAVLEERGQKALVYNVISASIDWVTGTERRARADFKILPRRKEDSKPAERKSELLKYLSDVNRTPFHVSRAFTDAVKVGLGWMEDAINDDDDGEPLYSRYESWRAILWDSNATEMDLTDSRYMFRSKWVDLDIAKAMFKGRDAVLNQAAAVSNDFVSMDLYGDVHMDSQETELEGGVNSNADRMFGYQRQRVRLIEGWIRMPVEVQKIRGGPFAGEIFDKHSPGHWDTVEKSEGLLVKKVIMRMHVAIFTSAGMLWYSESPYRHNSFPFTPIWGKRRGRDNLPYGMVRGMKDIQEDINKRASKALHILSSSKVIMDEGAVDDLDAFLEEVHRPDAVIVKKAGKDLRIDTDRELSQFQLELMSRSISMIQQASGVTDELLGRQTNATSGVAIGRRQDQGSMATALYFDNLRLATQLRGEKQLSNVEQFVSEKKAFRITNKRGAPQYVEVNDGLPENDIVRSKADFIISDEDWHATLRQAAVDQLMELMTKLPPQVGLILLDLVVENMDIANRDELVKRIRAVSGQRDPDAEELTPEEQQAQQVTQAKQQYEVEMAQATLRTALAKAGKTEAEAARVVAQIVADNVDAQGRALATATQTLVAPPAAAHVADHILAESGFVSKSDQAAAAPPPPGGLAPPAVPETPPIPADMPPTMPDPSAAPGLAAQAQL